MCGVVVVLCVYVCLLLVWVGLCCCLMLLGFVLVCLLLRCCFVLFSCVVLRLCVLFVVFALNCVAVFGIVLHLLLLGCVVRYDVMRCDCAVLFVLCYVVVWLCVCSRFLQLCLIVWLGLGVGSASCVECIVVVFVCA